MPPPPPPLEYNYDAIFKKQLLAIVIIITLSGLLKIDILNLKKEKIFSTIISIQKYFSGN